MAYRGPDGVLYPSREWYEQQVAKKEAGRPSVFGVGTRAKKQEEIDAGKLTETPPLQVQEVAGTPPETSGAFGAFEGMKALLEQQVRANQERAKQAQEQMAQAQAQRQETKGVLQQFLERPTTAETREQAFARLGVQPEEYFAEREADIAATQSLMETYNQKLLQKEAEIARIEDQPIIEGIINSQKISAEKKYNIELSKMSTGIKTQLAVMEMKQGNFNQAQDFVNQAVKDHTYDLELEYEQLLNFQEQNDAEIAMLDKSYQNALDSATQSAFDILSLETSKAEQIGQMMLQYPTAGITFDDTIEGATTKASRAAAVAPTGVADYELRTVGGNLYRVDPQTGATELLVSDTVAAAPTAPITTEEEAVPQMSATEQKEFRKLQNVTNSAITIERMIRGIGAPEFGPLARVRGLVGRGLGAIGLAPEVKTYNDFRKAMIAPLARAISGEVGTLTDKDIKRAEGLLPSVGESEAEITRKLTNLKTAIIDRKVALYQSAGLPVTPDIFDWPTQ